MGLTNLFTRVAGGVVFAVSALLVLPASRADETNQPIGRNANPSTAHVTSSLHVPTRSVTVQARPTIQQRRQPVDGNANAKQMAFIDANGRLTGPPAGFQPPQGILPRASEPIPYRSAVDPKAVLIDTSHVRAIMSAHVDSAGRVEVECHQSAELPKAQRADEEPKSAKPSSASKRVDK